MHNESFDGIFGDLYELQREAQRRQIRKLMWEALQGYEEFGYFRPEDIHSLRVTIDETYPNLRPRQKVRQTRGLIGAGLFWG